MRNIILVLLLVSSFSFSNVLACSESGNFAKSNLATQETLSPLQIVIADLQDSISSINSGDKKTAIKVLKSAKNELRKVTQISKRMQKGMGARLQKAINAVKKGDNTTALDEINHVLSELQGF